MTFHSKNTITVLQKSSACPGISGLKERSYILMDDNVIDFVQYKQTSRQINTCKPANEFVESFCEQPKPILTHSFIVK